MLSTVSLWVVIGLFQSRCVFHVVIVASLLIRRTHWPLRGLKGALIVRRWYVEMKVHPGIKHIPSSDTGQHLWYVWGAFTLKAQVQIESRYNGALLIQGFYQWWTFTLVSQILGRIWSSIWTSDTLIWIQWPENSGRHLAFRLRIPT